MLPRSNLLTLLAPAATSWLTSERMCNFAFNFNPQFIATKQHAHAWPAGPAVGMNRCKYAELML